MVSYLRSLLKDTQLVSQGLLTRTFPHIQLLIFSSPSSVGYFLHYDAVREARSLILDGQTLLSLDIIENSTDRSASYVLTAMFCPFNLSLLWSCRGTLYELLNKCASPFGKRRLRQWICHPLRRYVDIVDRQQAVEDLVECPILCDRLRQMLSSLPDLERLLSRIHSKSIKLADFTATLDGFARAQKCLADLGELVEQVSSRRLKTLLIVGMGFPDLAALLESLAATFDRDEALQGR
jgi:DNA mismatch repair protein MSH6